MDMLIGKDFEAGLVRLKAVAETPGLETVRKAFPWGSPPGCGAFAADQVTTSRSCSNVFGMGPNDAY